MNCREEHTHAVNIFTKLTVVVQILNQLAGARIISNGGKLVGHGYTEIS